MLNIKVLFFASARELTGKLNTIVTIAEGSSTEDLTQLLLSVFPELDIKANRMSLAINQTYCRSETILNDGDEVAILPPISGG